MLTVLAHAAPAWLPDTAALAVVTPSAAQADARPGIKVLALNVWHRNQDHARLVRVLAESGADVLLLSEVTPVTARALQALSPIYPHAVTCAPEASCGQLLLSRLALRTTGTFTAAAEHPALVWAEIGDTHPAAGLKVASTHLFRPSRNWARHVSQRDGLIALLNKLEGPLVLGGDLNVSGRSHALRALRHGTGLVSPDRDLPTWPAARIILPQIALDHILVRGGPTIIQRGVGPYAGSDHLPVWSVIRLGKSGV